jgi:DNA-directed RNA polymerase subunit M/transcription elongation factor TFIIS
MNFDLSLINLSSFYILCGMEYNNEKEIELKTSIISNYYNITNKLLTSTRLKESLSDLCKILNTRLSHHPLDIIGCLYITDQICVFDIIYILYNYNLDEVSELYTNKLDDINNMLKPRNVIINKIIDYLYEYEYFKCNIEQLIDIAKLIERSCYNATITNCQQSDNPPPRNWDSYEFQDVYYSSKCGIILRLLSLKSQSTKEYGSILANKIINKSIDIDRIGFMTENEICPISQEHERQSINIRMNQKIDEKSSTLYKCPMCKQRKTTYITKQLRSLDESADTICTCLNCSHVFRVK